MVMTLPAPTRVALLLWLCCVRGAAAAEISVHAEPDPALLEESFQIVFEATGELDGDPDFTPLERDFNVLSTAQASRFNLINGRASSSRSWTLTVTAKRSGRLQIPPVSFGGERSPAATVSVNTAAAGGGSRAAREAADVFIEVEAQPLKPLLQQQVIYTVRLYLGAPVSDASLSEPKLEQGNAIIQRLDEDRNSEVQLRGRRYRVLERRYAVFPQSSGRLLIGPLQFQGRIGRETFSLFDPFGPQPRMIVRQSAPVSLVVQGIPADHAAPYWLPARQLQLVEEWAPEPPQFRVGEPVTRTLRLSADGLSASQLPDFDVAHPPELKSYPDQPSLNDSTTATGVVGNREQKIALIPSAPGDYLLPAIRIPWWNTQRGTVEYAELPERHVRVLPAAAGAGAAVAPVAASTAVTAGSADDAAAVVTAAPDSVWRLLSLALAAGWLLTLWFWFRARRGGGGAASQQARIDSARRAARAVREACAGHSAERARDALLRWAALCWPHAPPRSIGELAGRCDGELGAELRRLNAALYARAAEAWNGAALREAFERAAPRAEQRLATPPDALEPLFRL